MAKQEKSGAADYIWLAYSVFFFFEPIARHNARYWTKTLLLYVVFLGVYVAMVRSCKRSLQYTLLGLMALIGLIGLSFNGGAACFFTFAAAFLPFVVEETSAVIFWLIAEAAVVALEGWLLRLDWTSIIISIFLIAIVGSCNIFIGQKKRANAKLSRAHDEIERLAALAERERIARDMHDVLGHTLSVIVLKSELARRLLEQSSPVDAVRQTALAEIVDVENTARKALAEVRHAITGYRSEGLAAELELARSTLRAADVKLDLDTSLDPAALQLSATEETVLSLALREAVTNIVRHAKASRCVMRLSVTGDGYHALLVEDDGQSQPQITREGNGLRGMRERVQSLGGRFRVGSGASLPGTALLIELPSAADLPRVQR